MSVTPGSPDQKRPPRLARVPWWLVALVGVGLLVLGVVLPGRLLVRGGPFEDGIVLLVASWLLWQWQHRPMRP